MNNFVRTVFTLVAFLSIQAANAKIVEIKSMKEVIPYINSRTLIVFDIDNTILEPVQTLGTDQAFGYWVEQEVKKGKPKDVAVVETFKKAMLVAPVSEVRAVERKTPEFIAALQSSGLPVVALTARPGNWVRGTLKQLASLNVSFKHSAPRLPKARYQHADYADGVLFLAHPSNKGDALVEYVRATGIEPTRILFIDDKVNNVESVEKSLNETSYEHASFRYGAADERVAAFNPLILQTEWREFLKTGRFISDDQAAYLLTADRHN
jgi:hypothetical protein